MYETCAQKLHLSAACRTCTSTVERLGWLNHETFIMTLRGLLVKDQAATMPKSWQLNLWTDRQSISPAREPATMAELAAGYHPPLQFEESTSTPGSYHLQLATCNKMHCLHQGYNKRHHNNVNVRGKAEQLGTAHADLTAHLQTF